MFHEVSTTYLGSSTGLRLRHVQPTGHYGCTGKNAELTNSAWVGGATRDFADVDAAQMAADLTTRLGWGERRIDLPAGRYDTVLSPHLRRRHGRLRVLRDERPQRRRRSHRVLQARRWHPHRRGDGEEQGVRFYSDPAYPGRECAPFVIASGSSDRSSVYDNGLATGSTDWIADGRLTSLIQTRHNAAATGAPATPGVDNLVLDIAGGTGTEADLVAGVDDGLLLTCLWYIREVDPQTLLLTGLTRDGVYRVEGGEITRSGQRLSTTTRARSTCCGATPTPPRRSPASPASGVRTTLPHRHAGTAHPRLQHELIQPGALVDDRRQVLARP